MKYGAFSLALAALQPAGMAYAGETDPFPVPIYDAVRTVFFDSNDAQLSSEAIRVVDFSKEIADHYQAKQEIVTGYCDAEEIAHTDCAALARRRAESVAAELVRLGMKRTMIEIRISQEFLVPTPRDVQEPQDRRVAIDPI